MILILSPILGILAAIMPCVFGVNSTHRYINCTALGCWFGLTFALALVGASHVVIALHILVVAAYVAAVMAPEKGYFR